MHFRPSFKLTLVLLALAALFLRLGLWQLERQTAKATLFERFANAPSMGIGQALDGNRDLARVEAFGRYDPTRHVLLDNKVWNGRAGVHVLTPFRLEDGRSVLVNRGWLPLTPDRRSLPEIPTDDAVRAISGRLRSPVAAGLRLGGADVLSPDRWPQLVTYLELPAVSAALGQPLPPWILQLDADDATGFADRQWTAAAMPPDVHGAYAFQWFALAAASLIIWITLGWYRGRPHARQSVGPRPSLDQEESRGARP